MKDYNLTIKGIPFTLNVVFELVFEFSKESYLEKAEKQLLKSIEQYIALFGQLPSRKHQFFIAFDDDDDEECYISLEIDHYISIGDTDIISMRFALDDFTKNMGKSLVYKKKK
jgi:hypothetical protein